MVSIFLAFRLFVSTFDSVNDPKLQWFENNWDKILDRWKMKSHQIGIVAVVFIAVMMGFNTALSTTIFFIFLAARSLLYMSNVHQSYNHLNLWWIYSFCIGFFNETQAIVSTDLLDVFNIRCTTVSQSLPKMVVHKQSIKKPKEILILNFTNNY